MDLLQAVFNHLVLPPQVPGRQEADIDALSHDVLTRIIHTCVKIEALMDPPWAEAFRSLRASFQACLALHLDRLERLTMLDHFRNLQPNAMLILHVAEQNAALLIRRVTKLVYPR